MQRSVTDGDITELVGSTAEAASAYIRGDIRRYLEPRLTTASTLGWIPDLHSQADAAAPAGP